MKILVAAASAAGSISGLQRHALNVARCLLLRPEISAIHFVLSPWQSYFTQVAGLPADPRLQIHIADIRPSSLSRNFWYIHRLPQMAARLEVDLVHFTYPMPVNASAFHCPTLLTLHDFYPYEIPMNFGFPKFLFNRAVLWQCVRKADAIACVSDATRACLKRYVPAWVWEKATRVFNCVEPETSVSAQSPIPGWRGEPFLLCIAQHRRNKNIPTLIRAFNRLRRSGEIDPRATLVMIGMDGPESGRIRKLVTTYGLGTSVRFLSRLTEPELQWCYRNCETLVAPSLTEGFGLPVAEGLLAGCKVVCSDIPAHREIADGHCHFVKLDENADEALAAAIAAVMRASGGGPVTLPQFSAPTLGEEYVNLYRRVVASPLRESKRNARRSIGVAASESRS
jgi:glycosyltransferase involved in cell wall biosynthesis